MAYVDRHSSNHRAAVIVATGAIQLALGYALITGLAGVIAPPERPGSTGGFNIPLPQLEPTPTPTDQRTKTDRSSHGESSDSSTTSIPIDFGQNDRVEVDLGGGGDVVLPGWDRLIEPTPTPVPTLAPKPARPIGNPGLWVTERDYPSSDLRLGREGTTRFRLSVGADGKPQACEIVITSGSPSLDAAACAKLMKRSRFSPASDGSGIAAPGSYISSVRWTIPAE